MTTEEIDHYTKWISVGLKAFLSFALLFIGNRITDVLAEVKQHETKLAVLRAEMDAIKSDFRRFADKQDMMLEILRKK